MALLAGHEDQKKLAFKIREQYKRPRLKEPKQGQRDDEWQALDRSGLVGSYPVPIGRLGICDFPFTRTRKKLPTNTLVGSFPDLDSAHDAFEMAVAEANRVMLPAQVAIERRYIVQCVPAGRFTAKREWVKTNIARLNKFIRRKPTA
jgi:hypothetical protein